MSEYNPMEGYKARCFACKQTVPISEMIQIKRDSLNTHFYFLCDLCHGAYFHAGYSNIAIYDDLRKHDKLNNPEKYKGESEDIRRKIKVPITLEEQAELSWNLVYNKSEVFKKLDESIERDKQRDASTGD